MPLSVVVVALVPVAWPSALDADGTAGPLSMCDNIHRNPHAQAAGYGAVVHLAADPRGDGSVESEWGGGSAGTRVLRLPQYFCYHPVQVQVVRGGSHAVLQSACSLPSRVGKWGLHRPCCTRTTHPVHPRVYLCECCEALAGVPPLEAADDTCTALLQHYYPPRVQAWSAASPPDHVPLLVHHVVPVTGTGESRPRATTLPAALCVMPNCPLMLAPLVLLATLMRAQARTQTLRRQCHAQLLRWQQRCATAL